MTVSKDPSAETDRLTRERDEARKNWHEWERRFEGRTADYVAVDKELRESQEALKAIVRDSPDGDSFSRSIARAALAESGEPSEPNGKFVDGGTIKVTGFGTPNPVIERAAPAPEGEEPKGEVTLRDIRERATRLRNRDPDFASALARAPGLARLLLAPSTETQEG